MSGSVGRPSDCPAPHFSIGIISGSCVDNQMAIFRGQFDPVILSIRFCSPRCVPDTVLIAKRFLDLRIDARNGLALGDFEVSSTGFSGHPVQPLLAVLARHRENQTYDRTGEWLGIGKTNRVDNGVRSLREF